MKKQIKFKRTVMLLAVLLLTLIPFSAFAAETTLTTTVPSEFSVKIEIEGKGSVIVDGVEYSENAEIVVKRNEEISYKILSEEGYEIKSVFFNDADVTESLKDGVITIFADGDGVLKVTAVHTEHMATTTNIAFGFLLEAAGRKLYVTGDLSGSLREFPPAALNEAVDTLVVECAHFPAERLMEKLQDVIAKKVMIVHVFPVDKYDTLKEGLKDAAFEAIYPNDGEEYDI